MAFPWGQTRCLILKTWKGAGWAVQSRGSKDRRLPLAACTHSNPCFFLKSTNFGIIRLVLILTSLRGALLWYSRLINGVGNNGSDRNICRPCYDRTQRWAQLRLWLWACSMWIAGSELMLVITVTLGLCFSTVNIKCKGPLASLLERIWGKALPHL